MSNAKYQSFFVSGTDCLLGAALCSVKINVDYSIFLDPIIYYTSTIRSRCGMSGLLPLCCYPGLNEPQLFTLEDLWNLPLVCAYGAR
jgi:hypothetical protein